MKDKVSLIIPCYNEEEALPFLYRELKKVADDISEITIEYIFIDDGSEDQTISAIKEFSMADNRVFYISFSRNFGKEAAIYAGLKKATGDFVALIDADLQDPPSLLKDMYALIKTGDYDCVATCRTDRKGDPVIRSFFSRLFYRAINKMSEIKLVDGARDFRLMTRAMVDAILKITENNRFSKGIFEWVGFKTKWLPFQNTVRVAGKTKWSFIQLFLYSIEGVLAFSTLPLYLASAFGILFCLISFVYILVIIVKTLIWGEPVQGYSSTICIVFFIGGIQLLCIGILGLYLSKAYIETKKRPIFIIKEER